MSKFIYYHLYSKLCKMQPAVMFLVTQQSNQQWIPLTNYHWFCALVFSLLLAWATFETTVDLLVLKNIMCYIFSLKFKVHPQILKFLREINYDNNLINFFAKMVHFIKFAGKIFLDVIISVFSINFCTQICYNGRGGANSLVLISPPHKPFDLFWLCPGDWFTATEVFHQTR